MPGVRIYLDEDSLNGRLLAALVQHGCDVLTAVGAGRKSEADAAQLAFATADGRILFTANKADFARLHSQFVRDGRSHAGIVICTIQGLPPEEQARQLMAVVADFGAHGLTNVCAFIGRRVHG